MIVGNRQRDPSIEKRTDRRRLTYRLRLILLRTKYGTYPECIVRLTQRAYFVSSFLLGGLFRVLPPGRTCAREHRQAAGERVSSLASSMSCGVGRRVTVLWVVDFATTAIQYDATTDAGRSVMKGCNHYYINAPVLTLGVFNGRFRSAFFVI